jgi:hypothetical protein
VDNLLERRDLGFLFRRGHALQQVIQESFELEGNGSPEIDVAKVHRPHASYPVIVNGVSARVQYSSGVRAEGILREWSQS